MAEIKYLTAKDVMQMLQLSRNMVYKLLQGGKIPATKIGRNYRIAESDVAAFMQKDDSK